MDVLQTLMVMGWPTAVALAVFFISVAAVVGFALLREPRRERLKRIDVAYKTEMKRLEIQKANLPARRGD